MSDFETEIFLDGLSELEIAEVDSNLIKGYTFNPSLFKKLEVTDYLQHCKNLVKLVKDKPLSLEVTSDTNEEIIRQANILSSLGKNVYVKIPITLTNGSSNEEIINTLVDQKVKLNITAVFTIDQVKKIIPSIKETESIVSVFAGRLYDIGIDAKKSMQEMGSFIHENSDCKILWASPRMSFDYITAKDVKCDIITMGMDHYKKLSLIGKDPADYSLDTVKMFFKDANAAGYAF